MKRLVFFLLTVHCSLLTLFSQAPQKFNYQAVVRDDGGEIVADQSVGIKITILQGAVDGTVVYSETHTPTTNAYGLVTLSIGGGTTSDDFSLIDWGADLYFMKVEMDPAGGTAYSEMGTAQLLSVPYALFASAVDTPLAKLGIMEDALANPEDALFEVKRKDGQTVFAVYNEGVRVYVDDSGTKGPKGGFSVGGIRPGKGVTNEFFRVTPDSIRAYVNDDGLKGTKGGFAVGGFNPVKGTTNEFLRVSPDSVRIYVNDPAEKGTKGGFAVGGINPTKTSPIKFLQLTPDNYFIGHEAGANNTTGLYNTFIGYNAGYANTVGWQNIFLGYGAGYTNTSGFNNIVIGDSAGYDNTSGRYNILLGNRAGRKNTTGYQNIFIGEQAGINNEDGHRNIFLGTVAGGENIDGFFNIYIGNMAGRKNTSGSSNIFVGSYAAMRNTKGSDNIYLGQYSGYFTDSSYSNICLGNYSGYNNRSGEGNIFLGNEAGYSNREGGNNIFIGNGSGYMSDSTFDNIFIGNLSGYYNEAGKRNVFVGSNCGTQNNGGNENVFVGNQSGQENTIGYYNTFVGEASGQSNILGDDNTFIGKSSGRNSTEGLANTYLGAYAGLNATGDYNVFIGYNAGINETGSNKLYISNRDVDSNYALIYGDFASEFLRLNAHTYIRDGLIFEPRDLASLSPMNGEICLDQTDNRLKIYNGTEWKYTLLTSNTTNERNLFIGDSSGFYNDSGVRNVFLGYKAGYANTSGENNVFVGDLAGSENTSAKWNVFVGYMAGLGTTSGGANTFIGNTAGVSNSTGTANVFMGTSTGFYNTEGSCNTFLGRMAGVNNTVGDSSVFIGFKAGYNEPASHRLYIENSDAPNFNALIYGEFDNDLLAFNADVGIGTITPSAKLDIVQGYEATPLIRLTNGNIAGPNGSTLVSMKGINATEDVTLDFVTANIASTLQYVALEAGGTQADRLIFQPAGGTVGIGTTNPQGTLDVNGSIYQRGGVLHADYVFDELYELESIEKHADYMWKNKHLPAVPEAIKDKNGNDIVEWGARNRGVLEELEKAHVYIDQLNAALKEQQIMIEELKEEIEKMKNR